MSATGAGAGATEAAGTGASAVELIRRKRDGGTLTADEIGRLVTGASDGTLPDYQAAALLMAIFFRGLDGDELAALTSAMMRSGDVLDLADVPGVKVDKHSTGGVGDMISLPLAPLVAACGVVVPMISGRGLGHTGGTLDKLEAIPGFQVLRTSEQFKEQLRRVGCCLIGQTERLVPADRKLYALRDVTGTVESIPLIASSIMSKKLAEGIDALVLDVKFGLGAFMKTDEQARKLARTLVDIGRLAGKRVTVFLTDMNQPLGRFVGNALEVREAVATLCGSGSPDVRELVLSLAEEMLVLGRAEATHAAARTRLERAIASGAALAKFGEIVEAQGGDPRAVMDEDGARLPSVRTRAEVRAARGGVVQAIDAEAIGMAAVALGAGRLRKEDPVDPAVGIVLERKVGAEVAAGDLLALLHHRDGRGLGEATGRVERAFHVAGEADTLPFKPRLILEVMR